MGVIRQISTMVVGSHVWIFLILFHNISSESSMGPRSGLKWISWTEAKKLPNGYRNKNIIKPNLDKPYVSYCRADVDGCYYPGEMYVDACRIITKDKVHSPRYSNFQLLYNPDGVAQFTWRPWPKGTDDLNFPHEVVKSDKKCNLMVGRYNDHNENAWVDSDGYVYYQHGPDEGWYWDNNEYDLLVERTVKKIELLDLQYQRVQNKKTKKFEGDKSTSETLMTNRDEEETELSTTLSMSYTDSKSWTHSVQIGVSFGVEVEVTSPGKALLGGAAARYKFDASFSYTNGWQGGEARTRTVSQTATKQVPPNHRIRVNMFMTQTTEDVPFTAKSRLNYEDGSTKVVNDKGVLKNVFYSNSQVETHKAGRIG